MKPHTTELYDGKAQVKLASKLGLDGIFIPINGYCGFEEEAHDEGTKYVDEWGITYIKGGWPVMVQIDVPVKNRADWKNYQLPDPAAPHRTRLIEDAVRANEDELAIIVGFLGPFTMMYWYFMDLATLSLTVFDDPELITEMCDAYTKWVLEAAKLAYEVGGIDVFMIADDWGGTTSLLMSPGHLRQFFVQPFGDIVRGLKAFGIPDTGINGYHPVERAASMDLSKIKARYGKKICPIGNINNKTTMVTGTPEDVEREALECLKVAAPYGGYILATDHSLHDDIPIENIYAYIEVAKKYGTYPLNLE